MAYDKDDLYKKGIEAIQKEEDITFFQDVWVEMGISHETFYRFFPKQSEEYEEIKRLLERNKVRIKRYYRRNWKDPNASAGLQMGNYKLLATSEELERLNPPKQKEEETEEKAKPLVEWTEESDNE